MKFCCSLFLFCTISISQAATFKIECRNLPPEIIVTGGGCIGPVVDIVETALKRMKHKFKWQPKNWETSLAAAKKGDIDMLIFHKMNKERAGFLSAVAFGYEINNIYYYVNERVEKPIYQIEDLNGLTVGATKGDLYSQAFETNNNITKRFYSNTATLIQSLELGLVDAAVLTEIERDLFSSVDNSVLAPYVEQYISGHYISIANSSKMIRYFPEFKAEIEDMIANDEIEEFFLKYHLEAPDQL